MKILLRALFIVALGLPATHNFAATTADTEYENVAEEYIKGYFTARPLQGTALGLHEYDGKISDYSRLALDAELSRLRRFDDRLRKFDLDKLSPRQSIDLRILQAAIRREIFQRQEMSVYERNPMVYARAADLNVYIKRNFAPLEDRVRSITADRSAGAEHHDRGEDEPERRSSRNRTSNLPSRSREVPRIFLRHESGRGSRRIEGRSDSRRVSQESNRKAAAALADYAAWLERERLPKASPDFAIGEEKYKRMLAETELVDLAPEKVLEMGMAQLKSEQKAFADAAKEIDPTKPANRSV